MSNFFKKIFLVALCIFVLFSILYAITLIEVDPVFVTIAIIIFGLTPKQSISKKLKISNEEVSLDMLDVHQINPPEVKLDTDLLLDDIEVLA
jgi:hypothetical protein